MPSTCKMTLSIYRGENFVSEAVAQSDSQPLLVLKKLAPDSYQASIRSLEFADTVLKVAGDKKMVELRACLEGNGIILWWSEM